MSRRPESFEGAALLFKAEKWVQIHAGKRPVLFYGLHRLRGGNPAQAVGSDTELLIEGFPRSANSFAVVAFAHAQQEAGRGYPRIANNLHVPAQVVRAAELRVPALVLIRNPKDAVASFMLRDPISASQALRYYASFYEAVGPLRDSFILGRFEEVVRDYGAVLSRVNQKFDTDFAVFDHTPENAENVFAGIDNVYEASYEGGSLESAVSRPSSGRERMKREVEREIEAPRCRKLLDRAEAVYEQLAGSGFRGE